MTFFRTHPDWAITEPERENLYSRHELLLDLTKPEVRDYIVASVSSVLDSADIRYVKWDMNRQSTANGTKAHDYILGLYEVLRRIFAPRPDILLESCSSGGNRFDLGMLCFSPKSGARTIPILWNDWLYRGTFLSLSTVLHGGACLRHAPRPDTAGYAPCHAGKRLVLWRSRL